MRTTTGKLLLGSSIVGLGLLAVSPALSHGVHVSHSVGEAVSIQASFASGEPMAQAQVSVFAPEDGETPWITGTTDPAGHFAFVPDPSQAGRWEVQVRLAGHGKVYYLPVSDAGAPSLDSETEMSSQADGAQANEVAGDVLAHPDALSHQIPLDRTEPSSRAETLTDETGALALAASPQSAAALSLSQKVLMGAVFAWGCLGTALYVKRGNAV